MVSSPEQPVTARADPNAPLTNGAGAAARAAERRSTVLAVLGLLAVLSLLLRETLFGGLILTQADALLEFEPWIQAAPEGHRPGNPLLLDQSLVIQPWLHFAHEELAAGRLPLWNPYDYGGQPVHAAYTGAFLWPLNWLHLASGSWHAFAWIAFAKLGLAGIGMLVFLRRGGLRASAAAAGAFGYALCGFNVVWLGHPHTNVAALFPWALIALGALAEQPTARRAVWVAVVAAGMLVGGHIQTATHTALVLAAYVVFRATTASPERPRMGARALALAGAGALVGAMVAAPALLPFAEYLGHSRAATLFEEAEATDAVALADVAPLLVAPNLHGNPAHGDYTGPKGLNLNYSELVGPFVGRLLLILAVAGAVLRWRDGRVRFLAGLSLFALLVAWQAPPLYDLLREVPRLRSTKLMRFGLFAAFGLSALGAVGLDACLSRLRRHVLRRSLGLVACVVVAAELLLFARGYNPATPRELVVPDSATVDFLHGAGADQRPERVLGTRGTYLFPNANLFHRLALPTGYDSIEDERMAQLVGLLTSDERARLFVKEIGYFDRSIPLLDLLGVRWALSAEPLPPPFEAVHTSPTGLVTWERPMALGRAFVAKGARRVDDDAERLALLGAEDFDPRVALFEGPPPAGAQAYEGTAPPGEARLVGHAPGLATVAVDVDAVALLVFTETFDQGWHAEVDGRPVPVQRLDHALCGIWLQPGDRTVEMRYAPASFRAGLVLAAVGLLVLALCTFGRSARRSP
ncbi:YfhO family protein [Engelhardtia mirabilis]|uniref:Bacterial membrane protein YfhO n=1 Tax=Engelhardtia mirabilis TaxID=2528011 RepID=A0A518BFL6_9BACT|nr:Bacterial membrane protein YfhO [Planctomycetes bacterium Pla133]QDV00091.1 Bacterial membrane protein YfhO [Planctomycetes bacterium Pla86]